MATDKNTHLDCVLTSHKLSNEQELLDKHIEKKNEIKEALEAEYTNRIYAPFNSGSYAKNTAINSKFDFDTMVPFKRDAFGSNGTLENMYESVYTFLHNKYQGNGAYVRKQKVSIGVEYLRDNDGHIVKIDVVPGRELNQDQYQDDKKLNLYVNELYGKIAKGSDHLRSNIQSQIENIRNRATSEKDSIRKVIRLLKVWKVTRNYGPKSFFLELITIKAFDTLNITGSIWDKLKAVLEYIRDNAETISLPDPGNSGNDVADTLTDDEKRNLSQDMKYVLDRIEQDSDYIKSYFPVNPKHPCKDNENTGYGKKREGVSVPPATRFG